MAKLKYFTNLDFPEIRGPISLPKRYLLGKSVVWGRDEIWPDRIHGIGIFTDPWMVDVYGKLVGKCTKNPWIRNGKLTGWTIFRHLLLCSFVIFFELRKSVSDKEKWSTDPWEPTYLLKMDVQMKFPFKMVMVKIKTHRIHIMVSYTYLEQNVGTSIKCSINIPIPWIRNGKYPMVN